VQLDLIVLSPSLLSLPFLAACTSGGVRSDKFFGDGTLVTW